ncbi:MAG: chitobiase/beta-hexosaminidase C-terminal domain-containing protein, partial [Pseudomonadales bacterium]|nr:chitobiase/beta-hexosaminidase C-terminal domain-containing protein [Pseudomonadales bacterium]
MIYQHRRTIFITLAIFFVAIAAVFFTFSTTSSSVIIYPNNAFHDHDIRVTLSSASVFSRIYYTLDGSVPNPDSENTFRYHGNIELAVPSVTLIRAMAIDIFGDKSEVVTQTFFLDEDVANRFRLPVVSVTIDPFHLYDHETGIFVEGRTREELV